MSTTLAILAGGAVSMAGLAYYCRSHSVSRVLKCIFTHPPDDQFFTLFRAGLVEICGTTGTTLDYVNVPEAEVDAVAYKDTLLAESRGHDLVLCQHLPDMAADLGEYLSPSVHRAIVVKNTVSSAMVSSIMAHRIGFDNERLLQRILELLPDRPAIVSLPWFVDVSRLDASVTVERFSEQALLARARSDSVATVILPSSATFDYTRVRGLFPRAKLGLIGVQPPLAGTLVEAYVWQEPRDQGVIAGLLAVNRKRDLVGEVDVLTDVKFHK